jgi:hypothetical protein
MGPLDAWIVYRFVRTLVTPWDETDAFKLGVIDASGKLKIHTDKLTDEQQKAYTLFYRLVFNIKRLIEKIPGGKSKIGTYAAALFLLREQMGDEEGILIMERSFMSYLKDNDALESTYLEEQYLEESMLSQGKYKLINNMLDTKGDELRKGTIVIATKNLKPITKILGIEVFQLIVQNYPKKVVVVSREDIREV